MFKQDFKLTLITFGSFSENLYLHPGIDRGKRIRLDNLAAIGSRKKNNTISHAHETQMYDRVELFFSKARDISLKC